MEAQDRQAVSDALQLLTSARAYLQGLLDEPSHQLEPVQERRIRQAWGEHIGAAILNLQLAIESKR